MTRTLTVDYLAADRLGLPYRTVARLDRRDGRQLFVSLTGYDEAGKLCFTATALFLTVSIDRLLQHADDAPRHALMESFAGAEVPPSAQRFS
ncbi:MAG TPA: hypothetical protein VHB18_01805 [Mycobacteriales bacterium]|nr:hypothetical protein [Mycobacteriales bacterium]